MAKDKDKYYKQQEVITLEKTKEICTNLPEFCVRFIFAKEVAIKSKYAYAQDIKDFLNFMIENCDDMQGKQTSDFTINDFQNFNILKLENYSLYMKTMDYAANTRSRRLSSVRSLFRYLCRTDQLGSNPADKLEMPTGKMRMQGHDIRYLSENEINTFLYKIKTNTVFTGQRQKRMEKWTLRNYAIVAVFLHTGIRLSECVGLDMNDVDLDSQKIYVWRKGGKKAEIYINTTCCNALSEYLKQRKQIYIAEDTGNALFISAKGNRLSARMVETMISDCAKACQLSTSTVHSLRSSYGTQFYNQTGDVYLLSENLGHSSVDTTTKHYAKMLDEHKQKNKSINLYEN